MTPRHVYSDYKVMPNLQLHQTRVAAVGKMVCENLTQSVKTHDVILACLFHDMGNIIKFDLKEFPEFRAEKGLPYWESVKADFIRRYGDNAHQANVAIAKEISLPPSVVSYIDGISFSNLDNILTSTSYEQKICEYADMRVGPYGVLPLKERLREARSRYIGRGRDYYSEEGYAKLGTAAQKIEKQIFSISKIKPEDITDKSISNVIEELSNYTF